MTRKYRKCLPPKLESKPQVFSDLGLVYRHVAWDPELARDDRNRFLWGMDWLAIGNRHHSDEPVVDVLTRMPTDMSSLRLLLRRPPRARLDCSDATWRNVRASIYAAMRWCKLPVRARRRRRRMRPSWTRLIANLPRYQRLAVEAFADWCDSQDFEPEALSQSVFESYAQWLELCDTGERPDMTYANLCHVWNKCAGAIPSWPAFRVTRASGYDHFALPWTAFAPTFRVDVDTMTVTALNPDPLANRKPRRLRSSTAHRQAEELRRLASALVAQTGRDPQSITGIADLVEPDAARDALRFLIQRHRNRHS